MNDHPKAAELASSKSADELIFDGAQDEPTVGPKRIQHIPHVFYRLFDFESLWDDAKDHFSDFLDLHSEWMVRPY